MALSQSWLMLCAPVHRGLADMSSPSASLLLELQQSQDRSLQRGLEEDLFTGALLQLHKQESISQ